MPDLSAATIAGSRRGFTLIELLIAFMLIGIIAAIMGTALRLGFRTVDHGGQRIDALERFRSSVNIVDAQLQSHNPLTVEEEGEKKFYFQGGRESLQFASNYSIWGGAKGYVGVNYSVAADTSGKRFISVSENVIGMETARKTWLFNPVDDIYFEYFYKGPTDEKGSWVDTWTDTTTTPEKMRLHLVDNGREFVLLIPMRTIGTLTEQQPATPATPFRPNAK